MYKFAFAAGISVFALAMIASRDLAVTEPVAAPPKAIVVSAAFPAPANEASMQHVADATEVDQDGSWRQWPTLTDF